MTTTPTSRTTNIGPWVGKVPAETGTGTELLNDPEVARLYLGAGASGTMGAAVASSPADKNP